MSRILCKECKYNNNGWCNIRKTNKLKDLIICDHRETENLVTLKECYDQKKWQYENIAEKKTSENKGILKGIKLAIDIMSK